MQSNFFNNIGFLFILIALTVGGRFLMSYWLSRKGWAPLSRQFPASEEIEGTKINFVSMRMGGGIYKNCVVLIYNDQGLYMRMLPIFKMFHPPLFIPWNQFHYDELKSPLSFKRYKFEIGSPAIATIILTNQTLKDFRNYVIKEIK